jgi:hypothetical protein
MDTLYIPKRWKTETHNVSSHLTMEQKVINGFFALLTHTKPIHQNSMPLSQVVQVNIFPNATVQTKNVTLVGVISPNALPRTGRGNRGLSDASH